jgi:L-tartrate/succinate antiporter
VRPRASHAATSGSTGARFFVFPRRTEDYMSITTTRDGVRVAGTSAGTPNVLTAPPLKVPHLSWRALVPIGVTLALALLPPPAGLALHAWYFFAIFAGVIVALMVEPLPGGAIGLIGVTLVAVLAPYVLFGPAELAKPGFKAPDAALTWALSGFANSTVWLIFGAFMFALGYEKTGLGRRLALLLVNKMGRRTLTLGYAIAIGDTILAPFTPSNTARSAGTLYPVIRNLPALYGSKPDDPSARRIGSYLMWVAIATTCVTSSMFLTALAPNLLAVELVNKTSQVSLTWTQWFVAFAPIGIAMLVLIPLVTYYLYPPEVKEGEEVPKWAAAELGKMGSITKREILLAGLVVIALALWVFGGKWINATTAALVVISLMLVLGVVSWDDIVKNHSAWNTLAWFATLVALADGLNRVGFVKWFADTVASNMAGFTPFTAMIGLVVVFYFTHYLFASVTAHVTALLPVMLAVGATIPGMNMPEFALLLCLTLGIMGILTPYATGPSPVYYGSGYLPARDYWRLGAVFGVLFIALFLAVTVPWLALIG